MAASAASMLIPWTLIGKIVGLLVIIAVVMVAVGIDPVTVAWDLLDPFIPEGSILSWFGL